MTLLVINAIEESVTKENVVNLINYYQDILPADQSIGYVIDRAWYVTSDLDLHGANKKFRNENIDIDSPLKIYAGLNLTRFKSY